jgi:hypothetical protein
LSYVFIRFSARLPVHFGSFRQLRTLITNPKLLITGYCQQIIYELSKRQRDFGQDGESRTTAVSVWPEARIVYQLVLPWLDEESKNIANARLGLDSALGFQANLRAFGTTSLCQLQAWDCERPGYQCFFYIRIYAGAHYYQGTSLCG